MVQKYQSPVRVYKYPFELVMRAYEMRFPTCDMIPIVRETEILEEVVNDETGIHMIDRRAKVSVNLSIHGTFYSALIYLRGRGANKNLYLGNPIIELWFYAISHTTYIYLFS